MERQQYSRQTFHWQKSPWFSPLQEIFVSQYEGYDNNPKTKYNVFNSEGNGGKESQTKRENELHTVRLFSSSGLSGATGGRCTYLINLGCCNGTGTWRSRIGKKMRLEASLFTSGVLRCLFRTPITLGALSCTGCGLVRHVVGRAWDMIACSPATRIGITTCSKHNLVSQSFS